MINFQQFYYEFISENFHHDKFSTLKMSVIMSLHLSKIRITTNSPIF